MVWTDGIKLADIVELDDAGHITIDGEEFPYWVDEMAPPSKPGGGLGHAGGGVLKPGGAGAHRGGQQRHVAPHNSSPPTTTLT